MLWLYHPFSEVTQASISDIDIHWTNDVVVDEEDKVYTFEYLNPADLKTVFFNVGGGVHTISCFYRMSPVTLLGSVQLALKGTSIVTKFIMTCFAVYIHIHSKSKLLILLFIDTAKITVNYEGFSMTFSDVNNPIFPSAQDVQILAGTRNIVLTCSIPECIWKISNDSDIINIDSYIIPEIPDSYSRTFSLVRMTSTGVSYTTAHVHIHAQAVAQSPSSNILVIAVVIVLVLLITLAATIIIIPLCIFYYLKKRNTIKRIERNENTIKRIEKVGIHNFVNIPQPNPSTREYLNIPVNTNPEYMTIDETTMIPLKSLSEQKQSGYQNVAFESTFAQPNEENNETNEEFNNERSSIDPHGGYVQMDSVRAEKKFVPKCIPTDEFLAIYQQYVTSGIDKESPFCVEFTYLNEDAQINVMLETDESPKLENKPKNSIKHIIPFDENRVILKSTYHNCDYINASYIHENQFIASIHPTDETHRDFLQMIYQTEASMVIMLTTRKEKAKIIGGVSSRIRYWPTKDESIHSKPFISTLINSTETNAFIRQEISLENTLEGKNHSFTQVISPIWNEDGTVVDMSSAVNLLSRILKQLQDSPTKSIIIHCEDGISKTGIVLTAINCVKEMNLKKTINIFNTVKNLRRQRMKMVPTQVSI